MTAIWILFVLIILISLLLAYISMKDFPRSPEDVRGDNSLFLIRDSSAFGEEVLYSLYQSASTMGLILSIERLVKGRQSALVVYGPKAILKSFVSILDLLELEDYTNITSLASAWEFGVKKTGDLKAESLFLRFPLLGVGEQVWYQLVLQARKSRKGEFWAQIRVIVISPKQARRDRLFRTLGGKGLAKLIQPLSSAQILDLYKKRSIVEKKRFSITAGEIIKLWTLP